MSSPPAARSRAGQTRDRQLAAGGPVGQEPAGFWRRLRHPRRRYLAAVVAVVVVLAALWVVAFSPLFGVRTVMVRGAARLGTAAVLRAADVTSGTPLLRLDTAAVERRIEQLPQVARAQVSTSFPSTVVITVSERVPVGALARRGGFGLVDRGGRQFETVRHRPAALPLVVLSRGATQATVRAVASVAARLPAAIRADLQSIQAIDPSAITLVMRDGRVVRWGSVARSADKARLLPALLQHRSSEIDLTDPDQPFTR